MSLKNSEDILDALRCMGYISTDEQKKEIVSIINEVEDASAVSTITLNSMVNELLEIKYSDVSDFAVVANILRRYIDFDIVNKDKLNKKLMEQNCIDNTSNATPKTIDVADLLSVSKYSSIFDDDIEKVYSVRYMEYTNAVRDTVCHNTETGVYINVGKGPFLIRESELIYYSNFGGGYESIDFVGMITKSTKGGRI